jgi:hypothetical protein
LTHLHQPLQRLQEQLLQGQFQQAQLQALPLLLLLSVLDASPAWQLRQCRCGPLLAPLRLLLLLLLLVQVVTVGPPSACQPHLGRCAQLPAPVLLSSAGLLLQTAAGDPATQQETAALSALLYL